jgi:hypothetical protein
MKSSIFYDTSRKEDTQKEKGNTNELKRKEELFQNKQHYMYNIPRKRFSEPGTKNRVTYSSLLPRNLATVVIAKLQSELRRCPPMMS